MESVVCQTMEEEEEIGPVVEEELEAEDLSRTCRRDSYCAMCRQAFCSHCCAAHHASIGFHDVVPIPLDAAGRPVFPTHYPGTTEPITDFFAAPMVAADYVTPLVRDAYCVNCMTAFCASACYHHHHRGFCRDLILRIEERGGRHYVRCRGDEQWFVYLERILGDPVEDDGDLMLLPLLRRKPGTCLQCGGPVPHQLWLRCSPSCAGRHNRDLARRREHRNARCAARQLANLHIGG